MADGYNDVRALRVAELMNDYRTLQLHISEQTMNVPMGDARLEGYRVLRESLVAVQTLLTANYSLASTQRQHSDEETQKTQLREVIYDASARRFQAHRIYLRVAAARRWIINRSNLARSAKPHEDAARLREIDAMLQSELATITDQFIYSDLRAADVRTGHWVDEDPPLATVLYRVQLIT